MQWFHHSGRAVRRAAPMLWLAALLGMAVVAVGVSSPSSAARRAATRSDAPGWISIGHAMRQAREAEIWRTLDETSVELRFVDEPLQGIVRYLNKLTGVQIALDLRALDEIGVPPDTPVTVDLQDISFRSALDEMLSSLDLTYVVRHELLVITSQEAAAEELEIRVYPVGDLLLSGGGSYARGETSPGERLTILIIESVDPATWEDTGGEGHIVARGGVLVVNQNQAAHRKIAGLLAALRSAP